MNLALCALLAVSGGDCPRTIKEIGREIENPERVFPVFQCLLREGLTGKAHKLLTPDSYRTITPEELYLAFTSFEAPRRMILRAEVHKVTAGKEDGVLRICNPEFGVGRDIVLRRHGKFWLMKLTPEDRDYLLDRALGWFRRQVKRADGWHFAYPPDWTYAPLRRRCPCKR